MGLAPILVQEIFDIIQSIKIGDYNSAGRAKCKHGITNADRAYVMETDPLFCQEPVGELMSSDEIKSISRGLIECLLGKNDGKSFYHFSDKLFPTPERIDGQTQHQASSCAEKMESW